MILFCSIMSVICTTLLSVFGGVVDHWTDFWIVILLLLGFYVAWILATLIFAFIVTLPINKKKPNKKPIKFYQWLFHWINDFLIISAGVKLKITGMEKLDPNTRYLFVANHRSNFDPQIIASVFKKYNMLMISKPSNFKIPIVGKCIHAIGYMAIDRENDRKAIETILKSANLLKQGYSINIMPEGTRNKESLDLLPFKNGGFKVAQRAKAPIVVLSFNGTEKIHKNFPFKRTVVHMDIVDIISVEDVLANTTDIIGERAYKLIQQNIDSYKIADATSK